LGVKAAFECDKVLPLEGGGLSLEAPSGGIIGGPARDKAMDKLVFIFRRHMAHRYRCVFAALPECMYS
jgi:hypothetical protein